MEKKKNTKSNFLINWWREQKIRTLQSEIANLEAKKEKVTKEKDSFESFLGNLSNVSNSLFDLSNNLGIVHNKAISGVSSEKITPKLNNIEEYGNNTKTCNSSIESLIEKANKKIVELNEELERLDKSLNNARANLAQLGG